MLPPWHTLACCIQGKQREQRQHGGQDHQDRKDLLDDTIEIETICEERTSKCMFVVIFSFDLPIMNVFVEARFGVREGEKAAAIWTEKAARRQLANFIVLIGLRGCSKTSK